MLARVGRLLLDAVAPRRCAGCDSVSDGPLCPTCARRLDALAVPASRQMPHGSAFAAFEFTDLVRTILHRGKYGGDRAALVALGALTATRLDGPAQARISRARQTSGPSTPDAVVPIPLGPRRRRHRGYNQAEIIARTLAEASRVPLLPALRRTRETATQTARHEDSRRTNVAGAFTWEGTSLASAAVWLVDDVLTTGATVEAAETVLRRAGASRIDVVVIAVVL